MAAKKKAAAKKSSAKKQTAPKATARKTSAPHGQHREFVKRINPIGFMQSRSGGWLIRALDTDIEMGDIVEVPRKDGSVSEVKILTIVYDGFFEDGTHCILAKFRNMNDNGDAERRNPRQSNRRSNPRFSEEEFD